MHWNTGRPQATQSSRSISTSNNRRNQSSVFDSGQEVTSRPVSVCRKRHVTVLQQRTSSNNILAPNVIESQQQPSSARGGATSSRGNTVCSPVVGGASKTRADTPPTPRTGGASNTRSNNCSTSLLRGATRLGASQSARYTSYLRRRRYTEAPSRPDVTWLIPDLDATPQPSIFADSRLFREIDAQDIMVPETVNYPDPRTESSVSRDVLAPNDSSSETLTYRSVSRDVIAPDESPSETPASGSGADQFVHDGPVCPNRSTSELRPVVVSNERPETRKKWGKPTELEFSIPSEIPQKTRRKWDLSHVSRLDPSLGFAEPRKNISKKRTFTNKKNDETCSGNSHLNDLQEISQYFNTNDAVVNTKSEKMISNPRPTYVVNNTVSRNVKKVYTYIT